VSEEFRSFSALDEEDEGAPEWLLTYGDMVTLLLTFFVFLFSVSTLDVTRFESIKDSVQNSLGGPPGGVVGGLPWDSRGYPVPPHQSGLEQLSGLEEEPLLADIKEMVDKKNLGDVIEVSSQGEKTIILRVKGQVLFASAATAINPEARPVLEGIAKVVYEYPQFRLDIKGHTDPRPISTPKFDSNWELSALRATAVLRYLADKGISPKRMTATGYADTQPLVSNNSEENMAKNRRVEFVLEKKEK
jgi:chemotaxis protein MotB